MYGISRRCGKFHTSKKEVPLCRRPAFKTYRCCIESNQADLVLVTTTAAVRKTNENPPAEPLWLLRKCEAHICIKYFHISGLKCHSLYASLYKA
jgi:hypothetical protein